MNIHKLNDAGKIYILEKSRMDCVPGWYMRPSFWEPCDTRGIVEANQVLPAVYISSTLTRQPSGLHVAPSLLNLCISYVGENIGDVESLVDFPETVGKTLFEAATEKGVFSDASSQTTVHALNIFTQAYGTLVLESANLENAYAHISKIMPVISSLFNNITELNLFGCGFGGSGNLLQQISHFTRLERLSLQYNQITDTCLRVITAPTRVMHRGPRLLQVLDISRNPSITESSIRYLLCFKHLTALDLSGTNICSRGVERLKDVMGLVELNAMSFNGSREYDTCGWAAPVIAEWVRQAQRELSQPRETNAISSFYGNGAPKLSRFVKVARRWTNTIVPPAEPALRLGRVCDESVRRAVLSDGSHDRKTPLNQPNGKRLGNTASDASIQPVERTARVVDEVRETAARRKKDVVLSVCETPCEEMFRAYITETPHVSELSAAGNAPKMRKIFSLAANNDVRVSGLNSTRRADLPSDGSVQNSRKRRKIVVVQKNFTAQSARDQQSDRSPIGCHENKNKQTKISQLWRT